MINVGAVGTGWATRRFGNAAARVPGINLVGVYSRSDQRGRQLAGDLGLQAHWTDFDHLLSDTRVDAVYVASPNLLHFSQAEQALAAGKHVFLEKPAVQTAEQFRRLLEDAKGKNLTVFEGMPTAYDPGTERIRAMLPRLGTIRSASFHFSQRSARYDKVLAGQTVNIFDPQMGGGALYDLGVYCVSMMVDLFGTPDRLAAMEVPVETGADGSGAILASYPGMIVDLQYSKITGSTVPCQIQGELATLAFDQVASPREITVTYLTGEQQIMRLPWPSESMVYEIARFVELVGGGDPTRDHQRTLEELTVMDEVRESLS